MQSTTPSVHVVLALLLCSGCAIGHDALALPDASPPDGGPPPGEVRIDGSTAPVDAHTAATDAPRRDAGDPARCDVLTCSGIPGNRCLGDLCVTGEWTDVAFAETHACMIVRAPGPVHCLGANDRGQLGDGTRTASAGFVRVSGIDDAVRVFLGPRHSCALGSAGTIHCWGANDAGQCGGAGGEDALAPVSTAIAGVDSLALGGDHTCVLAAGEARCFGGNAHGQLADGTTTARDAPGPVIASDAAALGAGDGTTCVLAESGAVSCAGRNDRGQLGSAAGPDRATLARVGTDSFALLAVGDAFACAATTTEGAVRCWGANDHGQLGVGSTEPREGVVAPALESAPIRYLAAGSRHVLALDAEASAWGWGDDSEGQIPFDGASATPIATPVRPPLAIAIRAITGGTSSWAQDSLGAYFFGALADELQSD
jgi:alpha-tubulin suppressor-like RCC1 family protein